MGKFILAAPDPQGGRITIRDAASKERWQQILALTHLVEAHNLSRRWSSPMLRPIFTHHCCLLDYLIGAFSPFVVTHRHVLHLCVGGRWDVSPLPLLLSDATTVQSPPVRRHHLISYAITPLSYP